MNKVPRLLAFRPDEKLAGVLTTTLQRHHSYVRWVGSLEELLEAAQDELEPFDSIIIPLQILGGGSGISISARAKSEPSLSTMPLVGISSTNDKPIIQAFYDAGADIVYTPPIDADAFHFQVRSLGRMMRAFHSLHADIPEHSESRHLAIQGLDLLPEAVVVFDERGLPTALNTAARILFKVRGHNLSSEELEHVVTLCKPALDVHRQNDFTDASSTNVPYVSDGSILLSEKHEARLKIKITTLRTLKGGFGGCMLVAYQSAPPDLLSHFLEQTSLARSAYLLSSVACVKFLEDLYQKVPLGPLHHLESFLDKLPASSPLNSTMGHLLEFLDPLVPQNVPVKVSVAKNLSVGIRISDLYRILGFMVLYAVDQAGPPGEVKIECSDYIPGEGIVVVVSSLSKTQSSRLESDPRQVAIAERGARNQQSADNLKLPIGLDAAQRLADRYRVTIEYQKSSDSVVKLRMKLPLAKQQGTKLGERTPPG